MLTEPQTTPPTSKKRIIYAVIIGILFAPQFNIGNFYSTPEFALIVGNIYSYVVSYKKRLTLSLIKKVKLASDTYDYVFFPNEKFEFTPGQYFECTLPHLFPDNRGIRRFFSIASSPTEPDVTIGVKFYRPSSTFKKELISMKYGDKIYANQLSGNFTLSDKFTDKFVFIAGGIGITPFRSMLKELIDNNTKRDIVLFYACSKEDEFVYKEVLEEASDKLQIKTFYLITRKENTPKNWKGESGYLNTTLVANKVPDYYNRKFYISGPNKMVDANKKVILELGVPERNIVTDYFPGY